jgi:hypothetical protein
MLVMAALVLAACGSSDGGDIDEPKEDAQVSSVLQVAASEYAYTMPGQVASGIVTFEFTNDGEQPHEYGFVQLLDNKTFQDLEKLVQSGGQPPEWAEDMAGVPVLSPGLDVDMTRELEPGSYAFFCFLPTPEGAPHATEGMIAGFEVAETRSNAELPKPDILVTADEQGFDVPEVDAGTQVVEFRNEDTKEHEFALISYERNKGPGDLDAWFGSGYSGRPPAIFPGGIQSLEPGTSVVMTIDFESGRTYTLDDFPNKLTALIEVK